MRKLVTWVLVTLGIAALARRLRRRRAGAEPASEATSVDDPAEALREKLAATRAEDTAERSEALPEAGAASVEERRAEVHEEGRAALEDMRSTGGEP